MELNNKNLVRRDTTIVNLMGQNIVVEYRLHKDVVCNPSDPAANPVEFWYLFVPRCNTCYMDHTEEKAFEDMHACFEQDFIRYTAMRLNEERDRRKAEEDEQS